MRTGRALLLVVVLGGTATTVAAGESRLLWRVETLDGTIVGEHRAHEPFNPASVVKVATSLWALDRLGPLHRYETRFLIDGHLEPADGVLHGNVVVEGDGDPDFQPENAWMVAGELRRRGVRRVTGDVVVSGPFWLGWEGGVEDRRGTEDARRLEAGARLVRAWNPHSWTSSLERIWSDFRRRRPDAPCAPPEIAVDGTVRLGDLAGTTLVTHRSNPLHLLLKRFNVFSNNDIIRIADEMGGVEPLETFLKAAVGDPDAVLALSSASGEGSNRMTAAQVVELLRRFRSLLRTSGRTPRQLLPVPGCDPGPVPQMFPRLARGPLARSVACKTGTLSRTDGGVAVVAGYVSTRRDGELLFCVAAESAGGELTRWRRREQRWLIDLVDRRGGAPAPPCPVPMVHSDTRAQVVALPPTPQRARPGLECCRPPRGCTAVERQNRPSGTS